MSNAAAALAILGGGGGGAPPATSAVAAFARIRNDPEAARLAFFNRQDVQRDISEFRDSANTASSLDDFLENRRSLEVVLTAFGLEAEINNTGRLKAIFNSDPDDRNSFANRLNDPRFGEAAGFFDIANQGLARFRDPSVQTDLIDRYLTNAFEIEVGNENPAAREALFFLRRINEVDSSLEILGDIALRRIVTTALGLPAEIANQSVQRQEALLDSRLDFDRLNTISSGTEENPVRSDLERVEDDLDTLQIGLRATRNAVGELSDVQRDLTNLRTRLNDLDNVTDPGGVLAREIPVQQAAFPSLVRQRGLIASAERALDDTQPNLDRLERIFTEAGRAETQEELTRLQAEFATLTSEITASDGFIRSANYVDGAANTTGNLFFPAGSAAAGAAAAIDPIADGRIATVIRSDGTAVVTSTFDSGDFLNALDAANTAFQAVTLESLSAGIAPAQTQFDNARTEFTSADIQISVNASSFNTGISGVNFGSPLNSQELSRGISAVEDALTRLTGAENTITEIRRLAFAAQQQDADIADLNTRYNAALTELRASLTEAGSASNGVDTFTFENLLTSGTVTFQADARSGTTIEARGGTLDRLVLNALPTTLSAANAGSILSDIDTDHSAALAAVRDDLETDRQVFDFAANTADPLGSIDAGIREIRSDLDALIQRAGRSGDNLLAESARDIRLTLETLGTTINVDAQPGFAEGFENSLSSLQHLAVTGAAASARGTLLNDALFAVGVTRSRISSEEFTLTIQQAILRERQVALTPESGSAESLNFLRPLENTNFAVRFIEQYLVRVDLQSVGGGTAAPRNANLLSLFQNIGGGGGLLNLTS